MSDLLTETPVWLTGWMEEHGILLWGVADLKGFSTPPDETGRRFPLAISWAVPMNPEIMVQIQTGPNQAYADEYAWANKHINEISIALADEIKNRGFGAMPLGASSRTDTVNIKGDFPHKTAATRAGLGWIGRHCQLITRPFGPWIRLGTIFTDMNLPCAQPIERNFCGNCTLCVDACPAKALTGSRWDPTVARETILDVWACDQWKKEHYFEFHNGHNCGICTAVCPHGLRVLKK